VVSPTDQHFPQMRGVALWWYSVSGFECNLGTDARCVLQDCPTGLGPSDCVLGGCRCPTGTCSESGRCSPHTTTNHSRNTRGTCAHFGCFAFRGPATCENGECICKEGYSADSAGVCRSDSLERDTVVDLPPLLAKSANWKDRFTHVQCITAGCPVGLGASSCVLGMCVCAEGTQTDGSMVCRPTIDLSACPKATGGTCKTTQCFDWRGAAECTPSKQCVCKDGFCADSTGVCRDVSELKGAVSLAVVAAGDSGCPILQGPALLVLAAAVAAVTVCAAIGSRLAAGARMGKDMGLILLGVWLAVAWNAAFPLHLQGDPCLGFALQTIADAVISFPLVSLILDGAWKLRRALAQVTAVLFAWILAKTASTVLLVLVSASFLQFCQGPGASAPVVVAAVLVPLGAVAAQAFQADCAVRKLGAAADKHGSVTLLDG